MFKSIHLKLNRCLQELSDLADDAQYAAEAQHRSRHRQDDMLVWLELIADGKATTVADEFERLLDTTAKAGGKITNVVLKDLVRQAVIAAASNTKK